MYRGFPVGHLLFWETGAGDNTRTIGTGQDGDTVPSQLIVDGQQRLTSLFAVIGGQQGVTKEYRSVAIRIAFRPADGTFRVADAAVARDPEFIADISVLWQEGRRGHVRQFFERLARKGPLDDSERDRLEDAIDRVHDLATYTFRAVVLSPEANEEEVADVFVRINSEGVSLSRLRPGRAEREAYGPVVDLLAHPVVERRDGHHPGRAVEVLHIEGGHLQGMQAAPTADQAAGIPQIAHQLVEGLGRSIHLAILPLAWATGA